MCVHPIGRRGGDGTGHSRPFRLRPVVPVRRPRLRHPLPTTPLCRLHPLIQLVPFPVRLPRRQTSRGDANDGRSRAVTLLVVNSLLRDVRVDKMSNGNHIKIRRKSGATLADIEQMIDDAAKKKTIDEIFIVGGTNETTSDLSVANATENISELLHKTKPLTPTIMVSSVLPS